MATATDKYQVGSSGTTSNNFVVSTDGAGALVFNRGTLTSPGAEVFRIGADGAASWNNLTGNLGPVGRRNHVINGNMRVAQRGFGPLALAATDTKYLIDRWRVASAGSSGVNFTRSSVTIGVDLPNTEAGIVAYAKVTGTITDAAGNNISLQQVMEDVTTVDGQVTVSFYARRSLGNTIGVRFFQSFGTGGSTAVHAGAVKVTGVTSTWARYSTTLTLPSIAGKTFGTANNLLVVFDKEISTSSATTVGYTGGGFMTGGDMDITGIQVERGSVATPFEWLTPGQNFFDCLRYYFRWTNAFGNYQALGVGVGTSTGTSQLSFKWPYIMRTAPVVAWSTNGIILYGAISPNLQPVTSSVPYHSQEQFAADLSASGVTGTANMATSALLVPSGWLEADAEFY